jgi:hypothetical protein
MSRTKQLGFALLDNRNVKHFGGGHLKNSNPKGARPISTKRSMHLVLRATRARGEFSLLKRDTQLRRLISNQGKAFGVKVYRQANGGNHLHLVVLPRSRKAFHGFIRAISGLIARAVLGVERGHAKGLKFWDQRPFTRIIEWGKDYASVAQYLAQNTLEAFGFVAYQPRARQHKAAPA